MKWERMLNLVGVHCEGEIGRVITAGLPIFPGTTILEKLLYINNENDWIKKFTIHEPRGCATQSVNILLPPVSPNAHASFIVLQADEAHALSGSNSMCVTTAILETGMVEMKEPVTNIVLDTAVGEIGVHANCKDGKVTSVKTTMCPSFAVCLDKEVEVEGLGEGVKKIKVDVGFGGCFFAMVDVNQLGIKIEPKYAKELVDLSMPIKKAVVNQIPVVHPEIESFDHIEYVMFTDVTEENHYRNATIIYPGRVDRSPCGTGTCARMAVMYEKGLITEEDTIYTESIIGGKFKDKIEEVVTLSNGQKAIIPSIEGRAWIYNMEQIGIDPSDPFKTGYTMSDTWGPLATGEGI